MKKGAAMIQDQDGIRSVAKKNSETKSIESKFVESNQFGKKILKSRNYFEDTFDSLKSSDSLKPVQNNGDNTVQVSWTDKRTGAQYLVKTNKVNPPQGDFRIKSEDADNRYRMIMGLPGPRYQKHEERPEENEEESEIMPMPGQVENFSRQRASDDIRHQQSFAVTREPYQDEFEWQDHGSYTVDPSGRIRDKPANTVGPFGTEIKRQEKVQNKFETLVPNRSVAQNSSHLNVREDYDIEKKIGEDRGLQSLVNSTFRAIFGSQVADHIVQRAEEIDTSNKVSFERQNFSRVVLESGLMRPWRSPNSNVAKDDRPKKDEATAFAVGLRALEALPMGPLRSELADAPKSQRETMTVALGRTILNAMSAAPLSARQTGETKMHDDVVKSMLASLTPNLFKGLVPSELLDFRSPIETDAIRVQGSSTMTQAPIQRESVKQKIYDEPQVLGPRSIGHLGLLKRRDPFNFDYDNENNEKRPELNSYQGSMHQVNFKTRDF